MAKKRTIEFCGLVFEHVNFTNNYIYNDVSPLFGLALYAPFDSDERAITFDCQYFEINEEASSMEELEVKFKKALKKHRKNFRKLLDDAKRATNTIETLFIQANGDK